MQSLGRAWKTLSAYRKCLSSFFFLQKLSHCHRADDGAKATIHLLGAATFQGRENQKTAANIGFGFNGSIFNWMASPGNEWRGKRAGNAMVQLHGMANGGIGEGILRLWLQDTETSIDQNYRLPLGGTSNPDHRYRGWYGLLWRNAPFHP